MALLEDSFCFSCKFTSNSTKLRSHKITEKKLLFAQDKMIKLKRLKLPQYIKEDFAEQTLFYRNLRLAPISVTIFGEMAKL